MSTAVTPKVKIKIQTSIAGNHLDEKNRPVGTFAYSRGDEVDWPADEAKRLVANGTASYVDSKATR